MNGNTQHRLRSGTARGVLATAGVLAIFAAFTVADTAFAQDAVDVVTSAKRAIATHPSVAAAKARREAAISAIDEEQARYLPEIDFRGDYGPQHTQSPTTRARAGRPASEAGVTMPRGNAELSLVQPLFDARIRGRVEAAEERSKEQKARVMDAQSVIALRAVQAHLEVMRNTAVLELAKANVKRHEAILENVRLKASTGGGPASDEQQARSRLATAQLRMEEVADALRKAQANYEQAVGEPPGRLTANAFDPEILPKDAKAAVDVAVQSSNTLEAARRNALARARDRDAIEGNYLPVVNLELSQSRSENLAGQRGQVMSTTGLVTFRFNLYRGGADVARTSRFTELARQAFNEELTVRRELEELARLDFSSLVLARKNLPLFEQQEEESARVVDAYRGQFDLGRRTLLDLLDSENELFLAQSSRTSGDFEYEFAKYRMLATMARMVEALGIPNEGPVDGEGKAKTN